MHRRLLIFLFMSFLTLASCGQSASQTVQISAVLGSNLQAFIALYGRPNTHSRLEANEYHLKSYPDGSDFLTVVTNAGDGSTYAGHVDYVVAQSSTSGWTVRQARTICDAFFPQDAVWQRDANASEKLYISATLATQLPTHEFAYPGEKPTPGLFSVFYISPLDTSIITSCVIAPGEQDVS